MKEEKPTTARKLLFPKLNYPEEAPEEYIPNIWKFFRIKPINVILKFYPDSHQLSAEEQLFFMKITEGIFGYNEQVRNETLKLLTLDYNVKYLAPYLTAFIKQTIHFNLVFTDLTLLIYSVRMTKNLISNPHVDVKLYLHDLIPGILSCALAKRICKYYYDNHWTLRDFSAYVIATICHMHENDVNKIKERVINIYMKPILISSMPLTSLYGGLKGLLSLGDEMVKAHIIPNLYAIGRRVYKILENRSYKPEDKQQILEAKHIRDLIINSVSPILTKTRTIPSDGKQFIEEFGYFGYLIFIQMKNLERMEYEAHQAKLLAMSTFIQ